MTRELTASVGRQNISLRDGAAALFRRKGLVLLTFLTVLVGTVIVTLVIPDKYESRMKILVKNQRVDVAITAANATQPSAMTDGEVTENQINSEIELLTGRDLLTQIVKECGLADAKPGWLSRTPPAETVRVERAVNQLANSFDYRLTLSSRAFARFNILVGSVGWAYNCRGLRVFAMVALWLFHSSASFAKEHKSRKTATMKSH